MAAFSMDEYYKGVSTNAYTYFGAHPVSENEDKGIMFRVYAPSAHGVDVVGDFNGWNGRYHPMNRLPSGVYELVIPDAWVGQLYKFRVYQQGGAVVDKADPFAFHSELRPNTASVITRIAPERIFHDEKWIKSRTKCFDKPLSIYEMHMGSWKKPYGKSEADGGAQWFRYDEIADELIKYVKGNNFTHIEILPLAEFPFDGSWGYQTAQYYSATSRYGTPEQLMTFVEKCHQAGIGVIIDFAFVHFVRDNFSLAHFDGTDLYEYPPSDVNQSEWGTYNFNVSRGEVQSFLISAAAFWLDAYHFDGIRMDAINNGIYWMGNKDRGVNDRSVEFFKKMNTRLNEEFKGIMLIAEDSSDYPHVTDPVEMGGLGFDYKWDMGWMNDTLEYMKLDPLWRKGSHNKINWSMAYFGFEKFILPLSHDEVVHGKATIVQKMFGGDYANKFAQARSLYAYMFTHPGKTLNFMGNELGMFREWDESKELDWFLVEEYEMHRCFQRFFREIGGLVTKNPAFYEKDYDKDGFLWINADDADHNVFSYYRMTDGQKYAVVINMSNTTWDNYKLGLSDSCTLTEVLNTDYEIYGGKGITNAEPIKSEPVPCAQWEHSADIKLAPFGTAIFEVKDDPKPKPEKTAKTKKASK